MLISAIFESLDFADLEIHLDRELTDELTSIFHLVTAPRSKRVRFHFFEKLSRFWTPTDDSMSLLAALSVLQGKVYVHPRVPFPQRISRIERWLTADRSVYAVRVALGALVYTVILLAPGLQDFFVQYSKHTLPPP